MLNFLNGFRKFSIILLLIIASSIFLITHHINGSEWVKLLTGVGVAFMGTNALEHTLKTVQAWIKERDSGKS